MQVDVRSAWRVNFYRAHGMHRTLGALAEKCHAFAKALHYKEVEFAQTPETAVESLISINNQLRQPEAAIGILAVAQNDLHMELKVCAPATLLFWQVSFIQEAYQAVPLYANCLFALTWQQLLRIEQEACNS